METKYNKLIQLLAEIRDINSSAALLSWDQQTYMPSNGAESRANQLSTLSKIAHEKFTCDEVGLLLYECKDWADKFGYDSTQASLVRVTIRDYEKAKKIPPELVAEFAQVTSIAYEAWVTARKLSDYPMFMPHLDKIVDLNIRFAECTGYTENRYDALIDNYEPDMKSSQLDKIFDELKKELVPLVRDISHNRDRVSDKILYQEFDEKKQWDFGVEVLKSIGFDFGSGRQDKSAHPFTTSFGIKDVRITTRVNKTFFPTALFGTIHECGHALYDMGFSPELERTPLAEGVSLGMHESQSRLWENVVGRSRQFWQYYYPKLQDWFPQQFGIFELDTFYRAINKSAPSLIRVEADEVTYNMHIFLRYELEAGLVNRRITVSQARDAWNDKMQSYLGLRPGSDADGILQDIHWSIGSIGYFPSYLIGNLVAVQLFNRANRDMPALEEDISSGNFKPLLNWLRNNVHKHGKKFTLNELVTRITGSPLSSAPYLSYIKTKFTDIYK
jgi:carboxypeptidase Taq